MKIFILSLALLICLSTAKQTEKHRRRSDGHREDYDDPHGNIIDVEGLSHKNPLERGDHKKLIGGGDHDYQPHKKPIGGGDHDYKPHKKLIGGGDHDYKPLKKPIGGGDHDYKPHKKLIGGGDHDYKLHKKLIGGGDHDYQPHKKLIGGGDHDYQHHKKSIGGGDHDYQPHKKPDHHSTQKARESFLGGVEGEMHRRGDHHESGKAKGHSTHGGEHKPSHKKASHKDDHHFQKKHGAADNKDSHKKVRIHHLQDLDHRKPSGNFQQKVELKRTTPFDQQKVFHLPFSTDLKSLFKKEPNFKKFSRWMEKNKKALKLKKLAPTPW